MSTSQQQQSTSLESLPLSFKSIKTSSSSNNNNNIRNRNPVSNKQQNLSRNLTSNNINGINIPSLLNMIKKQLLQSNIVGSQHQLQKIIGYTSQTSHHPQSHQPQPPSPSPNQTILSIINYLIAINIEQKQHNHLQQQDLKQTFQTNSSKILNALQIFVSLTQTMMIFGKEIYGNKNNSNNQNFSDSRASTINIHIYKHFRQLYQQIQELSKVFNQYILTQQQDLQKRDQLITRQIKCMQQGFMMEQQQEIERYLGMGQQQQQQQVNGRYGQQPYSHIPISSINSNIIHVSNRQQQQQQQQQLQTQTQAYIFSLRQEISNLHRMLIKNDQQFTLEIQSYNTTLRQMSNTIKSYEIELSKITTYQMKFQELQRTIVKMRQQKYKNQIVMQNMAKKIRNYEKQLKGDRAFLSPQSHQRLVSSPQTKFSMLSSKISQNNININNNNNNTNRYGLIGNKRTMNMNNMNNNKNITSLLLTNSPSRKSFF